jgi:hypothetical protein
LLKKNRNAARKVRGRDENELFSPELRERRAKQRKKEKAACRWWESDEINTGTDGVK